MPCRDPGKCELGVSVGVPLTQLLARRVEMPVLLLTATPFSVPLAVNRQHGRKCSGSMREGGFCISVPFIPS